HEDEVLEPFRILQEETRREPGCITYVVQRSRENPRHYLIYEQYLDDAALEAHRNSPHFKQYAAGGFYRFVEERRAELFDPIS
ncbi:MAG: antibiotic biosynthesis monooxygenase, partial [Acidobacteria bacterium]